MNMPKSRGLHAKIPSPKAIFIGFLLVTVKVLNSYENSQKKRRKENETGSKKCEKALER